MNGLKDVVGIISFKKENPNLLMHEIIFLIHTFDFHREILNMGHAKVYVSIMRKIKHFSPLE
jgi:hypothetical protein